MAFAETMTLVDLERWCQQTGAKLAGASLQVPLKQCAVAIKADIAQNFAEGHGPDGTAWPPLAHPRINTAGSDRPLRDTGILAASISGSGAGHIEHLSETELTIGTNLDYAALQQFGGTIVPKEAKMLAIPLTKEAKRAGRARRFPGKLHAVVKGGKGVLLDDDDEAQYALTVGPITVPARPFAGFSERVTRIIGKIFAEYLAGLVQ